MCKVIAFINMKGGVAKTTLSVNVALALSKIHHKRVLLVDTDPQFNATIYLMGSAKYLRYIQSGGSTILDIIQPPRTSPSMVRRRNKQSVKKPFVNCYKNRGKLDLIPSTLELIQAEKGTWGAEQKLNTYINSNNIKRKYDFVLIDCPPTISIFSISALLASDAYIIPVKPDILSSIGLLQLDRTLQELNSTSGKVCTNLGIVFTMVSKNKLMADTMASIRRHPTYGPNVFVNILEHSVRVARAVEGSKALFEYTPAKSRYGEQIKSITAELLSK